MTTIRLLTFVHKLSIFSISLAHEGRCLEAILKAEPGVASRGCGSQPQAREARTPPAGHYDPCCEELAVRPSEEMPKTEARIRSQENRHGGAPRGERPTHRDAPRPAGRGS